MLRKCLVVSAITLIVLAMSATSALANHVDSANVSPSCSSYTITLTAADLVIGTNYTIDWSITGLGPTTLTGSVSFTATSSTYSSGPITQPVGPLVGTFTPSGFATLEGQNTIPLTFTPVTFSCQGPPPPVLTMATGTTTCTGFCLSFSATNLVPGEMGDKIVYTMTLTPTAGGPSITVSGEYDFTAPASGTLDVNNICGNWLASGQNLTDSYTVTGTATLTTSTGQSVLSIDFTNSSTLSCGTQPPGKPFSIGPSSMEGALTISPGDWISGGYNFKFKAGNHPATAYTVTATVTVPVVCPDTSIQNIVIPLGAPGVLNGGGATTYTFNIPANDTANHASNDQNSILVWEGAVQAPATLCGGHPGKNSKGAIFNATVSQNPDAGLVAWQFHYRDPNAKGKGNVNCTDASNPLRAHADVCGASWSQTITDP